MPELHTTSGLPTRLTDSSLVARARQLVSLAIQRTATGEQVAELALAAAEQAVHPVGWFPPGLSHGQAGIALLHLYAARAGLGHTDTAFAHIREAVLATQMEPLSSPGLLGGTAGLALAVADCAREEPRFLPSLARLHDQLATQVLDSDYPTVERNLSEDDYDLVSGAAGVLAHLSSIRQPSTAVRKATDKLVDYLVWLSEPAQSLRTPHRWLLVPEAYPPVSTYYEDYPHGYLNLGLSHGIPGVAAALASTLASGHQHPGLRRAVDTFTSWIRAHQSADGQGPLWPVGVPIDTAGLEQLPHQRHDQIAWCYGTAGVASALLGVAHGTADDVLRREAVEAFEAVLRRAALSSLRSPTLCHGYAGLLMMACEFAPWSAEAREALPTMLDTLLGYASEDQPVIFRDQELAGNFVDDPGLLTGSAGVALTILAVTEEPRPDWFRAFFGR